MGKIKISKGLVLVIFITSWVSIGIMILFPILKYVLKYNINNTLGIAGLLLFILCAASVFIFEEAEE